MSEQINKIQTVVQHFTDEAINFDESDGVLKFTLDKEHYIFSTQSSPKLECMVVLLTEDAQPFTIDTQLETLLETKINRDQDEFQIGIHKFAHISWQFEDESIAEKVTDILKNSPIIGQKVLKIIADCQAELAQNTAENTSSEAEPAKERRVQDVIVAAFESRDWRYKIKDDERFILYTAFATEKYLDGDNDNSLSIRVVHDNKSEVIFSTPFIYKLHKDLNKKGDTVKRRIKLGLLNLKLTSSIKFISTALDDNDGEIFHEIRIMLGQSQEFFEDQVVRAVNLLRQVADDYSVHFKQGVFDDTVSVEAFSEQLYKVDETTITSTLVGQVFGQDETIQQLSEQQLRALVTDIGQIAKEKAQLLLDTESASK